MRHDSQIRYHSITKNIENLKVSPKMNHLSYGKLESRTYIWTTPSGRGKNPRRCLSGIIIIATPLFYSCNITKFHTKKISKGTRKYENYPIRKESDWKKEKNYKYL